MDNKAVGAKIKQSRTAKRITQKELANSIGKSEVTIRKYESGDIQVPNDVLQEIANILGTSVISLMDLHEIENGICKGNCFVKYLNSIGYKVEFKPEILKWHNENVFENEQVIGVSQVADEETYTVVITKGKMTSTFSQGEFEEFEITIGKSVEFELFKQSTKKN